METANLIRHPESLDKDTLYGLRQLVARYPFYQAARLLFLQNLFLLHDPDFGEELRRAAVYLPDRRALFNLVEAGHYELAAAQPQPNGQEAGTDSNRRRYAHRHGDTGRSGHTASANDRTEALIDEFLNLPHVETVSSPRRPLSIHDAATDYAAFLLEMDDLNPEEQPTEEQLRNQNLIDNFIENKPARIVLQEAPEYLPEPEPAETASEEEVGCFTETLAKIYVKQGRYEKAIEIITKLNLNYPKKSSYFADQIRFLRKLIVINNNKK
ncbi:MAG: tetratricopeptide repeat protein [Alloprevotella sp.]